MAQRTELSMDLVRKFEGRNNSIGNVEMGAVARTDHSAFPPVAGMIAATDVLGNLWKSAQAAGR